MPDLSPELIEKALRLTDWSQHEYRVDSGTGISSCVCGWTSAETYNVVAYDRHITVTVLATVADDLRAEAWDRGYVSGHSRAMRRMSDEPGVEPGINPYHADRIEARDECPDCGGDPSLPVPVDSGFCHAHHVGTDRIARKESTNG